MALSTLPRIRSAASRSSPLRRSPASLSNQSLSFRPLSAAASHLQVAHTTSTCTDRRRTIRTPRGGNSSYDRFAFHEQSRWARQFASSADGDEKKEKKKDLRESVNRMKGESGDESNDSASSEPDPRLEKIASMGASFLDTLSQTWEELVASGKPKDINKKLGTPETDGKPHYEDDDEAADKYEQYKGSTDIMVIDPEEHLSAWERMEKRLKDAPIIQDILEKSNQAYEKSGARDRVQKAQQKVQHLKEDAEEAWETSQNPWVYRASSVYDTLTAETEHAAAARQLRVLDPDFTMENWRRDVVEHTLPNIMQLFLEGRITELKPWLGESVYNRLAAEVRARKKEGVQMDTNVLAIMNAEILACEVEGSSVNVERGDDPIILLHFMCQQIHCVRKKVKPGESSVGDAASKQGEEGESEGEDNSAEEGEEESGGRTYAEQELGEIVEGSEDDIRANSYVVAFQREYDEENMTLNWKIVDFRFNGAIAYL